MLLTDMKQHSEPKKNTLLHVNYKETVTHKHIEYIIEGKIENFGRKSS